jgi:hypothetical protein
MELSLNGLQTLKPGLKAYTEFPSNHDVERHPGDVLYFFTDERELDLFRRIRVFQGIVRAAVIRISRCPNTNI